MASENASIQQALIHGTYDPASVITVIDTISNFRNLTGGQIESLGQYNVDVFSLQSDASGNILRWNVEQARALLATGISFNLGSTVIIADKAANIASLTSEQIAALGRAGKQVRAFDVTANQISLSVDQVLAASRMNVVGNGFWSDDSVTLVDTLDNIKAFTSAQFSALAGQGVVAIDVTGGSLTLTLDQLNSLSATVKFAASDVITVSANASDLAGLSSTMMDNYSARGVDFLNASDAVNLTLPQAATLAASGLGYSAGSSVTVTGAINELSAAQIAVLGAKGVDVFDAADPVVLNAAQAAALAGNGVTFAAGDDVTVRDTGANIATLSAAQIAALIAQGVDLIDVSGNAVTLTVAQAIALGQAPTQSGDAIAISDTGSTIAALSAPQIQALAAQGVTTLDASNNVLALSMAQIQALGGIGLNSGDAVALAETGAALSNLTASEVAALVAKGVDYLDARDNSVTLSLDMFAALGALSFAADDWVRISGTGKSDTIVGRASNEIIMGLSGNDRLDGASGNDVLWSGLGKDVLTGGAGRDTFVFSTKLDKRSVDKITDFDAANDTIWLENKIFKALGVKGNEGSPATLNKKFFTVGSHAKDKNDYVFYDPKKAKLFYDADGSGAKAAVEIASLSKNLKLTVDDFRII
jgi:Ca2+-binding RTX toxin-like protein